jgi:ABC-type transport system involved in cytochrome c biogenesis permease subunit
MSPTRIAPWAAGGLALVAAAFSLVPPSTGAFDLNGFRRLPVLEGGRVKPIDSVARNSLLMIRGSQSFAFQGQTVSADAWLLDVLLRPELADQEPVFRIDDPDVLGLIGLRHTSDRYFSFAALSPYVDQIEREARTAQPIDARSRTRFQAAVLNLFERAYLYYRLRNTLQPDGSPGLAAEIAARRDPQAAAHQESLVKLADFRPVPPPAGQPPDAWKSTGEALRASGEVDPYLQQLGRLSASFASGDAAGFNGAVAELGAMARDRRPDDVRQVGHEVIFNRSQPFYLGMVIYLLALLALFASWLWRPDVLQPSAFALLVVGALVHTAGLASRILLQGRPPVTNLYSSAVFVGWVAVILGVIFERVYRRGFATAVAAASGFATLIVAHHLASDGDTMEMMRAVLDSNFWLATHVTTITIGYGATFLAGAIAIFWTIRRHLARETDPAATKALGSATYGVVCFALLFSFVGTVLGGIWADQSWGRFWGWDPKENGALLIVLWNAIILHSRWGGYARERGIMAMAIFGNVITSLSWFGVNMLGVGLHSYGFMDKAFYALSAFVASQLALMALALLPRRFWSRAAWAAAAPATERPLPPSGRPAPATK